MTQRETLARKPGLFYGYVVVAAAFVIMVVMYGTLYSFGIFFNPLLAEFGWTRAATSGAFALCMILHGVLYIFTGRLTDRFGPRLVVVACGFFLGLGCLLMSQIGAIWQLYLFYGGLIGAGLSATFIPLLGTVARWFVKRRGIMSGIVVSGMGVGTVIMSPVASWLISNYGWRTSYIIWGTVALALVIIAALFLRRDPGQMGQLPYGADEAKIGSLDLKTKGFSLREASDTGQLWLFLAMSFCFGFSLQTLMVHIAPHATAVGISPTIAANTLATIGGAGIIGQVAMGAFADRGGNKLALLIGFILLLIALLWLQSSKEVWVLYLFAVIFGIGQGAISTLMAPMLADLFGLSSHGVIFGVVAVAFTIGGATGPIVAGRIFDITGSYQSAFLTCVALSAMGFILSALIKPTARRGGTKV